MAVHVSIHDVSPAWQDEVEAALQLAHTAGVRPALLVVPDFHGRAPLANAPAFCERLRALQASGHEIYLHGYYHRARGWEEHARASAEAGAIARLRFAFAQRIVSGGEAEFSDVTRDEALRRLDEGETILRDAGLRIDGFVAPAWSMPRWVIPLLAERGYRFTEDHTHVYDPQAGRARPSVVLNFASRTPARLLSSVAWCRMARPAGWVLPARIAIHPADMKFKLLRGEIEQLLRWAQGSLVARGPELLS